MVNFFIQNEDFKRMADILRPVVKYAKKVSKERLELQNICFSVIDDQLYAIATDGHKLIRYQFTQDDIFEGDIPVFHLVVQFVHIEKIVKALGESDTPLNIEFDTVVDDELSGCKLNACDFEKNIKITVPAQFSYADGPNGQDDVNWSNLQFPNWIPAYEGIATPIFEKINPSSLYFSSLNLVALATAVDKSGQQGVQFKFANSHSVYFESYDEKVTGVAMQFTNAKGEEDEVDPVNGLFEEETE